MTTIHTDQVITLDGITYTVRTDSGQTLGSYYQFHGEDTVTSADRPAEDNGVIGAIEAIAGLAYAAGVRGFRLSEKDKEVTAADDLVAEIERRVEAKGGIHRVKVRDTFIWANELGLPAHQIFSAMPQVREDQSEVVAA